MAIKIVSGINEMSVSQVGSTVGDVIEQVSGILNLEGSETAKVNGTPATDETVLRDGDILELVKPAGDKGSVTIINGINEMKVSAAGKDVSEVTCEVESILNLEGSETVKVNGVEATESTILKDGDKVEFVKPAGDKGAVKIINGINEMSVQADGKDVGEVVSEVESILNLTGEEVVKVNGVEATDETILKDGDQVEFVKAAGDKGIVLG